MVLLAVFWSCVYAIPNEAIAQCEPTTFMARNIQSVQISDFVELVFVLTASQADFDLAKNGLGPSSQLGLIAGSLNFDEARSKATRISTAVKLDNSPTDNSNIIAQQLSGAALQDYVHCLTVDHSKQGLTLWLDKREGEFLTLGAYWLSSNNDYAGKYDAPPIVRNGELIQPPANWKSGIIEKLLVDVKNPQEKTLVSISINGSSARLVTVGKLPILSMATKEVVGPVLAARSFRASSTVCGGGSADGCVIPTEPGGYLVRNSGRLTDFTAAIASSAGSSLPVDTPDRVCVRLTVSTGACEASNSGQGKVTVLERYPKLQ
jgi:hypothetical protein